MNVAEYVVKYLVENEIDTVFGVVGGASLWLCKALGDNSQINPVFTNHEQTAVMAAEGWARITGKPGVVFTINGPGMTNTVTGIAQAWTDSAPIILLSGNSNIKSVLFEREHNVRQYGTQDVRTDLIMQGITKKHYLIDDPQKAMACIDEAFKLSLDGRPGPVSIEIPINLQSSSVDVSSVPNQKEQKIDSLSEVQLQEQFSNILNKLEDAERPLILAGQGVRLSGAVDEFRTFVDLYDIPVVNSRMGIDSIESDNSHFVGRCGNHGDRASHFAIQSCDVLLIMGSRLAPNTTGYDVSKFSPQSYKIMLDIDENEFGDKGIQLDKTIHANIKDFLAFAIKESSVDSAHNHENWVSRCLSWRKKYPIMLDEYYNDETISTYRVVDVASKLAGEDDLIISDTGSCCGIVAQTWQVKKNQRVFISGGLSAMGYYITSIGLSIASKPDQRVICFVGDGSLQMNIQDLSTIVEHGLPIKIIVISNGGYQFVRMSQGAYGINPPFGTDTDNGLPIPVIERIIKAYGLDYLKCDKTEEIEHSIKQLYETDNACVLEVVVDPNQEVRPRLKSIALDDGTFVSPEYANLYPFLSDEVLRDELSIVGAR